MTDPAWPDPKAPYEFVGGNKDARALWDQQVHAALERKQLTLDHQWFDTYHLVGKCPRCGHDMACLVDFGQVLPGGGKPGMTFDAITWTTSSAKSVSTDVVCSCTEVHLPRGKDATGCGWGRGLPIKLDNPGGN